MRFFGTRNEQITRFAELTATKLGIYSQHIDITFENESVTGCDYGYTDGDTDYINISIFRKVYGEKVPMEEILQTIAHELVHARQLLTGDLSLEINNITWLGDLYQDCDPINAPWEIEAAQVGEELYQQYG